MVAMDLAPEARNRDVRSVKYERSPGEVNKVAIYTMLSK